MKKLMINPMPALRLAKKERVNRNFNKIASDSAHLDQAYAQKRLWAATEDPALQPEADLRGITVAQLSTLILSKPDTTSARELERQFVMKKIDDAKTPAELDAIIGGDPRLT